MARMTDKFPCEDGMSISGATAGMNAGPVRISFRLPGLFMTELPL